MGMFDNILVKQKLPLPKEVENLNIVWENITFQTKDLDNCLGEYTINEEGKLTELLVEKEYIPFTKEERKQKNARPWDLWKEVIEKSRTIKLIPYHGKITFYTNESFTDEKDFWIEFEAYFIYGQLDKIELKEFNTYESYKISNKRWEENNLKRQKHPWNLFKRYASYLGWSWFWRKLSCNLRNISNLLNAISSFISRHLY